ncbi:MAG: endonuclease/exonuclease/phosphatase family protein [Candidatus Kapabacteria bacterium]|nr:endonuclease/exonuclease/phosphatase family protein [Candidatus Kapabacteria bacterium]
MIQIKDFLHRKKILILIVCLLIVQFTQLIAQQKQIRIGTFNIEWLGDGNADTIRRNENDYLAIAKIIETIDCDVLALQEIENEDALRKVMDKVKRKYYLFIDTSTKNLHKVAILYDKSFQKIDEQFIHLSFQEISYKRPALYLKLKKKDKEFEFISLHLKSSSKKNHDKKQSIVSPKEIRTKQANELIDWMKKHQKNHAILLGDFNEEYEKGTILKQFENTFNSVVISKNMISCANPKWKMIDHIILPEHFRKTYKVERLQNYNHRIMYTTTNAPKISDHCLLYYTLRY